MRALSCDEEVQVERRVKGRLLPPLQPVGEGPEQSPCYVYVVR